MAQDEPELAETENILEWDESPAGFLMTKDEEKEWKKISTEAEARAFIELFWAKRNPDPASAFNPFKADFENKVRYADEQYTWDKQRGALTDRGRVLILMGAPHYSENRFPTETVENASTIARSGTDEVRSNAKLWFYDPQQLPEGLRDQGLASDLHVLRRKGRVQQLHPRPIPPGCHHGHAGHVEGARCLCSRIPDLTEVPETGLDSGWRGTHGGAAGLARRRIGAARWTRCSWWPRSVSPTPPTDPSGSTSSCPPTRPALDVLAGRVSTTDGEVAKHLPDSGRSQDDHQRDPAYHLTFPLNPGTHKIEVAGAAGGAPQIFWSGEVVIPLTPMEGTWMTPLMFGLSVVKEDEWQLGSPFGYGALHLMPLTVTAVPSQTELSYFGHVIRPGLNDAGEPELEVKVTLKMDGQRLGRPLTMTLPASVHRR